MCARSSIFSRVGCSNVSTSLSKRAVRHPHGSRTGIPFYHQSGWAQPLAGKLRLPPTAVRRELCDDIPRVCAPLEFLGESLTAASPLKRNERVVRHQLAAFHAFTGYETGELVARREDPLEGDDVVDYQCRRDGLHR